MSHTLYNTIFLTKSRTIPTVAVEPPALGVSIVLITVKELYAIKKLENVIGKKFRLGRIPGPAEVCESQLMALVKRIHDVEVDEKGISKYLPAVRAELEDLSKEDLVTRFVSIEFNRFLEYYRNAQDINANLSSRDHTRDSSARRRSGSRMFINLGTMDGFDPGKLLRFLCDTSNTKSAIFGRMDIKDTYSFIDVEADSLNQVVSAFRRHTVDVVSALTSMVAVRHPEVVHTNLVSAPIAVAVAVEIAEDVVRTVAVEIVEEAAVVAIVPVDARTSRNAIATTKSPEKSGTVLGISFSLLYIECKKCIGQTLSDPFASSHAMLCIDETT